jgi:pyridoxine 5-phosphate synthase
VPDAGNQLTSDHGWDTIKEANFLKEMIALFSKEGIRTSIFVDPNSEMVRAAADTGTHRIELYTEAYAQQYAINKEKSIANYIEAAAMANSLSIGLNAGHDLNLENLGYFAKNIPQLLEVSIGHALVCDALLYGMENTVQLYKRQLAATS